MDITPDQVEQAATPETGSRAFDPLQNLFVAQSQKPPHVRDINLRALSPFQRALLVIDGTVTRFIEAYRLEPIEVTRLSQEEMQLEEAHTWLAAAPDTTVLARQVLIRGRYSHTLYAHAVSLVIPARMPDDAQSRLADPNEGLGRILLHNELETRREVLWYGREDPATLPPSVRRHAPGGCLSRTYRIIYDGNPVMLINERFPLATELTPSQY